MVSVVLIQQQDTEIDSRSSSEVMNSLIADVQKAMQADNKRGGIAVDTHENGVSEIEANEGQPELVQSIGYEIDYRHAKDDPTKAA